MPTQIVTTDDLNDFKTELLEEIRKLIQNKIQPPKSEKKWYRTYQIKKYLNISHSTIQTLRDKGIIPFTQLGGNFYYDLDEIEDILKKNKKQNSI